MSYRKVPAGQDTSETVMGFPMVPNALWPSAPSTGSVFETRTSEPGFGVDLRGFPAVSKSAQCVVLSGPGVDVRIK